MLWLLLAQVAPMTIYVDTRDICGSSRVDVALRDRRWRTARALARTQERAGVRTRIVELSGFEDRGSVDLQPGEHTRLVRPCR